MNIFLRVFLGLLAATAGFMLTWQSEWIVQNFGRVPWAEEHLGMDGGTRLMWKLLGILIIILSFMGMTGLLGSFILSIFGGLFAGFKK